jgi:hypothetical protein
VAARDAAEHEHAPTGLRFLLHLWGRNLESVELIGIEPTTSGLQSQRSPN